MIPLPIAEGAIQTLSPEVAHYTGIITHYFAEDLRTARRFIKSLHPAMVIEHLEFSEIDKHDGVDTQLLRKWIKNGHAIGVMSDAGCPGIADPGAEIAAMAQSMNVQVIPLTGPNSLIMALMASGLNGQNFAFNGYLPIKEPRRSQRLKELEAHSAKEKQTQLFIETPYRNNMLLAEFLKHCKPYTKLGIAQNITAPGEMIKTKSIADWKKEVPHLDKLPVVFMMLAF